MKFLFHESSELLKSAQKGFIYDKIPFPNRLFTSVGPQVKSTCTINKNSA